jgi:hypothetical protein
MRWILAGAVAGVVLSIGTPTRAQNNVPCRYVPNGFAVTIVCANGFWQTIMPDGTIEEGNGVFDPNGTVRGSSIPLDGNGSIRIDRGQVTPPTQIIPTPAPGQGALYGYPSPE